VREIREELGVEITRAYPWITRVFVYPHATVRLHFHRVTAWRGEPRALEHQAIAWQRPEAVKLSPMLPANGPVLRAPLSELSRSEDAGAPEGRGTLEDAERARTLVAGQSRGALSTIAVEPAGTPFGSVVTYGLDALGQPTFFVSTMAEHTRNLDADPRASLLVVEETPAGADPLASGRVTLLGTVAEVADPQERAAARAGYLAANPAAFYVDYGDFRCVRLAVADIRYVGGFGSAARLKLVANTMLGITSAAAAELLAAGTAAGLDREQVFWALVRFAPALKAREAGFMRDQHEPTMFAVRDLVKDLGLALDLYERANAAVPLTREARALFAETAAESNDLDISAIVNAYASPRSRSSSGAKPT